MELKKSKAPKSWHSSSSEIPYTSDCRAQLLLEHSLVTPLPQLGELQKQPWKGSNYHQGKVTHYCQELGWLTTGRTISSHRLADSLEQGKKKIQKQNWGLTTKCTQDFKLNGTCLLRSFLKTSPLICLKRLLVNHQGTWAEPGSSEVHFELQGWRVRRDKDKLSSDITVLLVASIRWVLGTLPRIYTYRHSNTKSSQPND